MEEIREDSMSDGRTLFVAWLPDDTREDDVKSVFKRYGSIISCELLSGAFGSDCFHERSFLLQEANFATRTSSTKISTMQR